MNSPNFSIYYKQFPWNEPKHLLILLGSALLVISLFQISIFTSGENIQGYWILLMGWLGIFFFQVAWFANPLNLLALLLSSKKPLTSLILSATAIGLASQSFSFFEIPTGLSTNKIYIKELGLGFYLWFLAHCLFFLSTFIKVINNKQPQKNEG